MKLVLKDFAKTTNGYSTESPHRFIEGFIPHYVKLAKENSDANFKNKVIPEHPLVLSAGVSIVEAKEGKHPVVMIPNPSGDYAGKVIYSTDLWEFFIDDSTESDLGIPNGTPTSNFGIDAVTFNDNIVTTHPLNTAPYRYDLTTGSSWSAITSTLGTTVAKFLHTIIDVCLVTASSGLLTARDEVKIIKSDWSVEDGITLPGYSVRGFGTHAGRFALIFTQKTTADAASPKTQNSTSVFLWSPVSGGAYDEQYEIEGVYRTSIIYKSLCHVFTQSGNDIICSVYTGAGFREVRRIKNTTIDAVILSPRNRVSIEGDFFVLLARSNGNTTAARPLYWNPYTNDSFFLVGWPDDFPYKGILVTQDPSDGSYLRYLSILNSSGFGVIYKTTIESSTKSDIGALYKSNRIPAPFFNKSGQPHQDMPFGRMKINKIEVEYSVLPPSVNDIITLSLVTKDEYETESYTTSTSIIKNTTANSTKARVGTKRTVCDIGAICTDFEIGLEVDVSTTSWDLIIRRIIIDYDPISIQS